jgi:hypothetical protein
MRYFASALLTILIAVALPSAAFAYTWTYTFQSNVSATNLPSGAKLSMWCILKDNSGLPIQDSQTISANAPLTNAGSTSTYTGPINVKVSYSSPNTNIVPASYICMLIVSNPAGGAPLDMGGWWGQMKSNSGWTGTMWASGNLPG